MTQCKPSIRNKLLLRKLLYIVKIRTNTFTTIQPTCSHPFSIVALRTAHVNPKWCFCSSAYCCFYFQSNANIQTPKYDALLSLWRWWYLIHPFMLSIWWCKRIFNCCLSMFVANTKTAQLQSRDHYQLGCDSATSYRKRPFVQTETKQNLCQQHGMCSR